jgi:hypothetical protein
VAWDREHPRSAALPARHTRAGEQLSWPTSVSAIADKTFQTTIRPRAELPVLTAWNFARAQRSV